MRSQRYVILILSLLTSLAWAQPTRYEPFQATPEWGKLMDEIYNVKTRGQGVAHMRELAARERGRTIGAQALFMAGAYCEDEQLYRQLLQQIITEYPDSVFSVAAQISLMNLTPSSSTGDYYTRSNQILASFGCPTLDEIYRNRRTAVRKMRARPDHIKSGTAGLYQDLSHLLYRTKKYREAIAVCQFGEEFTAGSQIKVAYSAELGLSIDALSGRRGPWDHLSKKPEVVVRSPKPDHKTSIRPHIRFDIRTGDYRYYQPGIPKIYLDGQDISSQTELQTKYDLKSRIGPNRYYVQLRLSYRPQEPLAPGRHIIRVQVTTNEGGNPDKSDVSWSFWVERECRDNGGPDDDELGPNDD